MAVPWEDKAAEFDLDDMCLQALQSVPSERAHQILNDLAAKGSEVRNPSAFVSKAARETWNDNETLRRALEMDVWATKLDDAAKAELKRVGPQCALGVLADVRSLGDNIRNASSYVCSTLRKRMAEGKLVAAAGFTPGAQVAAGPAPVRMSMSGMNPVLMSRGAPAAFSMPHNMYGSQLIIPQNNFYGSPSESSMPLAHRTSGWGCNGPVGRAAANAARTFVAPTPFPMPKVPIRQVSDKDKAEIEMVIAEMEPDLDERATERVYQLGSAAEARKALEVLAEMGNEVRNKSAFIHGIVSKRLQVAAEAEAAQAREADENEMVEEFKAKLKTISEDLDERAARSLSDVQEKCGAQAGLQLLTELKAKIETGDLRNVSGFAFSMAKTRLSGERGPANMQQMQQGGCGFPGQMQGPGNMQMQQGGCGFPGQMQHSGNEDAAEFKRQLRQWQGDIDERAQKTLNDLQQSMGSAVALGVLKELAAKMEKEEVRNVSSFVYSMARQRLNGGMQQGGQATWGSPAAFSGGFNMFPGLASQGPGALMTPTQGLMTARKPLLQASPMGGRQFGFMEQQIPMMSSMFKPTYQAVQQSSLRSPMAASQTFRPMNNTTPAAFREVQSSPGVPAAHSTVSRKWIEETLASYDLEGKLDDIVIERMMASQAERIKEILEDMAGKDDPVRNPSAFIQKSLKDFPNVRKRHANSSAFDTGGEKRAKIEMDPSDPMVEYAEVVDTMDEAAVAKLRGHTDRKRVGDILAEMAMKGNDIRNPSAFVVRALSDPTRGMY